MPSPTPISQLTFAAIDFESAGASRGATDSPVQIGIATLAPPHHSVPTRSQFVSFISPGTEVTWAAQKVHGITTSDLEQAPALLSLWPEIKKRLTHRPVVAHGSGTERKFLRAFPMHGFQPWVDTLTLSRKLIPGLSDYSLGSVAQELGLCDEISDTCAGRSWHDALYDAVASLYILRTLIDQSNLANLPISALTSPKRRI